MARDVNYPPMPSVAILAGGLAKRLGAVTAQIPKSMVVVANEPFIAHQLRLLRAQNVDHVVICAGHLAEQIQAFVGDGEHFGLSVQYSFDGATPLGTGGALRKAAPLLSDYFLVVYGDSYLDIAYAPIVRAFEQSAKPALMTVLRNDNRWDTSNVVYRDGNVEHYSKQSRVAGMNCIDYGLGVLRKNLLLSYPALGYFDLADVYSNAAEHQQLAGFEVAERFYEIGSHSGLRETEHYLRRKTGMDMTTAFTTSYLQEVIRITHEIDARQIDSMIDVLLNVREGGGRLFFLGVGGGAGNAAHAVNDFRKISGIESYAPTDNASELTARVNDDGWPSVFEKWLRVSRLNSKDALFVFSVGGGNAEKNVSVNIVQALKLAQEVGAKVVGVVGRDGGYTKQVANACVVIPTVNPETVTPHTEAFQAVVWHLMVSHPSLKMNEMKWESTK